MFKVNVHSLILRGKTGDNYIKMFTALFLDIVTHFLLCNFLYFPKIVKDH